MAVVILHLGGNIKRLEETVRQAKLHPTAQVIISSEDCVQEVVNQLKAAGIQRERVTLNCLAYDTPGNLCTTQKEVLTVGAKRLYLVTDAFHMKRAMACARAAYCGTGIEVVPCPLPGSPMYEEPAGWIWANVAAVVAWRITGTVPVPAQTKRERSGWWNRSQVEYRDVRWN